MSKRHTHISISGKTHTRLKARADHDQVSMASIVEAAVGPALGLLPPKTSKKRP